eukprot:364648-Chlamydomonas_euryale.AAC.6
MHDSHAHKTCPIQARPVLSKQGSPLPTGACISQPPLAVSNWRLHLPTDTCFCQLVFATAGWRLLLPTGTGFCSPPLPPAHTLLSHEQYAHLPLLPPLLHQSQRVCQHAIAACLPGERHADNHEAMPDHDHLVQLDRPAHGRGGVEGLGGGRAWQHGGGTARASCNAGSPCTQWQAPLCAWRGRERCRMQVAGQRPSALQDEGCWAEVASKHTHTHPTQGRGRGGCAKVAEVGVGEGG